MKNFIEMWKLLTVSFLLINVASLTDLNYYEVLGLSKDATPLEIRQAYKKLAVKLHPDKNKIDGEAEQEKFLKITEAYETLKDPEKRRKYNLYGKYTTYGRPYDSTSQAEYNNLYYNGLYYDDENVDTLSGKMYYNYIDEGFHFINFYSPFCPPCQSLCDHWKKLAKVYKGIVKVGAVNCKYHNSFCYNSMRISSYPTLVFYPYGKNSNYVFYNGDRTFEALERFVLKYLRARVTAPLVWTRVRDVTALYVLGSWLDDAAVMRVAFHLKGLASVFIVDGAELRSELTADPAARAVLQQGARTLDIFADDEETLVRDAVGALPAGEVITPDRFKEIRTQLRNGQEKPWIIYFSTETDDKMILHKMKLAYPDLHFGEVNCDRHGHLCASLGGAAGAWGALKPGGAWQRAARRPRAFLAGAPFATRLHTISQAEGGRIMRGDAGVWLLAVIPPQQSWEDVEEAFVEASRHLERDGDTQLGILSCKSTAEPPCHLARAEVAILLQNRTDSHEFSGDLHSASLLEFVRLLKDDPVVHLTEQRLLEVSASGRDEPWLVGFLPRRCPRRAALSHQWRRVADKLRPIPSYRVGMLDCARADSAFCDNVRSPTVRVYPAHSQHVHVANMENLAQAPYLLEWALTQLHPLEQFTWHSFSQRVITEELAPSSGKKPWLVYFHSPRCHHCYEMYADFAIAAILLEDALQVGKVNCLEQRGLCQHEQITSYPSLRLYLSRNDQLAYSSVISIAVRDYESIVNSIRPHLMTYDENLLRADEWGLSQRGVHLKHDEF